MTSVKYWPSKEVQPSTAQLYLLSMPEECFADAGDRQGRFSREHMLFWSNISFSTSVSTPIRISKNWCPPPPWFAFVCFLISHPPPFLSWGTMYFTFVFSSCASSREKFFQIPNLATKRPRSIFVEENLDHLIFVGLQKKDKKNPSLWQCSLSLYLRAKDRRMRLDIHCFGKGRGKKVKSNYLWMKARVFFRESCAWNLQFSNLCTHLCLLTISRFCTHSKSVSE